MANQQRNQSTARAFGEHTFTHTSNIGGTSSSVAFSSSTGGGTPHWETSMTQGAPWQAAGPNFAASPERASAAAPNFDQMSVRELQAWLRARGCNFEGAIERSDLVEIAKAIAEDL